MVHMGNCNVVWNYNGAIKTNWLLNQTLSYKQEEKLGFLHVAKAATPAHVIPELWNDRVIGLDPCLHLRILWKNYIQATWCSLLELGIYINCASCYASSPCLMWNMSSLSPRQMTNTGQIGRHTHAESTPKGGVSFNKNDVDGICWNVTAGFTRASALLLHRHGIKMFECRCRCEVNEAL